MLIKRQNWKLFLPTLYASEYYLYFLVSPTLRFFSATKQKPQHFNVIHRSQSYTHASGVYGCWCCCLTPNQSKTKSSKAFSLFSFLCPHAQQINGSPSTLLYYVFILFILYMYNTVYRVHKILFFLRYIK